MNHAAEYETVCVLAPDIQADQLTKLDEKIKKIFTTHKVKEVTKKDWGLRKLAFPLKSFKNAHYVQYVYEAQGNLIAELERNLGYEESVLRYLTVKYDKHTRKGVQVEPAGYELNE